MIFTNLKVHFGVYNILYFFPQIPKRIFIVCADASEMKILLKITETLAPDLFQSKPTLYLLQMLAYQQRYLRNPISSHN